MKISYSLAILGIVTVALGGTAQADAPSPAAPSSPAAPNSKAPTINIQVAPEVQKLNQAYNIAIKTLSPEQMATLKTLEDEYLKIESREVEFIGKTLEVKSCTEKDAQFAKDKQKYQSELGVMGNQMEARQKAEEAAQRAKRVAATPFIDQSVLDDHYKFMRGVTIGMGKGLLDLGYQRGSFAKTNCADVAQKLDAAFAQAYARPPAPADAAVVADRVAAIQKAADGGNADAMVNLGMLYVAGQGVGKDVDKGMALLQKAADTGYERAEYILGLAYGTDQLGLKVDKEKAKYWLGKAAAQGNQKAAAVLAHIDDPVESLDDIRKKADAGDAGAEYDLGSRYSQGIGVDKNPDEALKWLLMSAGKGHPLAESDVAVQMLQRNRVAEGIEWMTHAAEAGVVNSQVLLAQIYLDGKLTPKDADKAAFWFKKAAAQGDSRASRALEGMKQ